MRLIAIVRELYARTRGVFGWRARETDLDEEVQFHIEMLVQEHLRRGLSAREARAAALRHFGGIIQMKEDYRGQGGLPFLETLVHDVSYAARTLARTPGFTAAAVLTLALGIGANSAIFSVVNAVLLQPVPYAGADRIVEMYRDAGGLYNRHSFKRFDHFRRSMRSFDAFAAYRPTAFNLSVGEHAEYVTGTAVSYEYFRALGGTAMAGRFFEPAEDVPNAADVVVLRYGLWQRLFAGDRDVIGRTVSLGERSFVVVGVTSDGFDSVRPGDFYVPLQPNPMGPGSGFNYHIVARLAPGVTIAQATAEAAAAFESYKSLQPNANFGPEQGPQFIPLRDSLSRDVKPALLMMLGAVGLLLLIACGNTASLLLARASGRYREISVRAALGAARGRIVRQLLTESLVLFSVGGIVGVALAYWTVPTLVAMTPPGYLPDRPVRVDGTVLLAALAASLLTGLFFGLVPALSLSRHDLVEAFKQDGTRTTAGRRSNWVRRGLVVSEVALCMLLLVGAGLLIQTFVRLRAVDVGFDTKNVITARMSLLGERYGDSATANRYFEAGLARIQAIPGVVSAAVVNGIPIDTGLNLNFDRLDTPDVETYLTDWRYATPEYFDTLGIQIVAGRRLNASDSAAAARVTVVSQQFVRQYFKDRDPLGQQITVFKEDGPIEIVGVAKDLREAGLKGSVPALMYVPAAQAGNSALRAAHTYFQVSWVVRASRITPSLTQEIREALRAVDPTRPVTSFRTIDDVKSRAMATERFQMTLLALFACIGLLLATAGIYGLIAYSVTERTREFGIRMALGASHGKVLRSVLQQGAALATIGILAGAAAAIALTRSLEQFLFDVSRLDGWTFAGVASLLLVIAVLASLLPALRAVRLNPVSALRQ